MKVLITGASSEISISLKDHLKSKGHEVVCTSRSASGEDTIRYDLSNPQESVSSLEIFLEKGVDALILNAASPTYRLSELTEIDPDEMDVFLKSNIQGNIFLLQKVLPYFVKQKFGRVIFISSMSTKIPLKGYSVYSAAKAAIENLIQYVALEYGASNVTANTLRLGIIHTQRNDKFIRRSSLREKMESSISLGRIGKPEDLHLIVDSLLDKNSYIQGATIEVSGGLSTPS